VFSEKRQIALIEIAVEAFIFSFESVSSSHTRPLMADRYPSSRLCVEMNDTSGGSTLPSSSTLGKDFIVEARFNLTTVSMMSTLDYMSSLMYYSQRYIERKGQLFCFPATIPSRSIEYLRWLFQGHHRCDIIHESHLIFQGASTCHRGSMRLSEIEATSIRLAKKLKMRHDLLIIFVTAILNFLCFGPVEWLSPNWWISDKYSRSSNWSIPLGYLGVWARREVEKIIEELATISPGSFPIPGQRDLPRLHRYQD
jgi:hypothetical protein